ncbi:MAG: DUF58 domain-containing protein [Verrucomicrobiales bacterium]|nr:DUF58 domain-containing protein [Verrucomicrobiales bacterium]
MRKGGYLEELDPLDERQFLVAVKRLADSLSYGTDRSPYLGSGLEYVQSRPYEPGDAIKSIDWRVTARTGKFFVKEYEAPKRMPVYLLIDTSASMVMKSAGVLSKYAWALQVAGGLAFACLDRVSPVGVFGVGEREIKTRPSLSRDVVMQWLHGLRHFRYDEGTTLGRRVAELVPTLPNRAMLVVLSDLHDPDAVGALQLAGQKHDVVVLQFRDPAEGGLRGGGFFHAQEAESGRDFVTHGRGSWTDPAVVEREMRKAGIDYLLLPTDSPMDAKLRLFFGSRDVLGRGAR